MVCVRTPRDTDALYVWMQKYKAHSRASGIVSWPVLVLIVFDPFSNVKAASTGALPSNATVWDALEVAVIFIAVNAGLSDAPFGKVHTGDTAGPCCDSRLFRFTHLLHIANDGVIGYEQLPEGQLNKVCDESLVP
jgi:hypothetical protein